MAVDRFLPTSTAFTTVSNCYQNVLLFLCHECNWNADSEANKAGGKYNATIVGILYYELSDDAPCTTCERQLKYTLISVKSLAHSRYIVRRHAVTIFRMMNAMPNAPELFCQCWCHCTRKMRNYKRVISRAHATGITCT